MLTVGAINKQAVLAPFSSIGNTADNRIKPDVVAVGEGADVIRTDGNQGKANGDFFLFARHVWNGGLFMAGMPPADSERVA